MNHRGIRLDRRTPVVGTRTAKRKGETVVLPVRSSRYAAECSCGWSITNAMTIGHARELFNAHLPVSSNERDGAR